MELRIEVLHAQDLMSTEYRFGDLSCSLLGIKDLRPFVEVTFQSQKRLSSPVHARGGRATFGWNACFALAGGDRRCIFRVYDRRGAQTALRGDPLIGEAVLPLVENPSAEGLVATFTLRNGKISTGQLTVHYELLRPSDAQLCPGSVLLGTAFGDVVCTGNAGEKPARGRRAIPAADDVMIDPDCGSRRSESSDSFCSAIDDLDLDGELGGEGAAAAAPLVAPIALRHHHRCENVAETYVNARMRNDLVRLRSLLAEDAVVVVPKPLGGASTHTGWRDIEAYLRHNPAKPGCFRDWSHVHTEIGGPCEGSAETTVVRWTGSVYKLGRWHQVRFDFVIDLHHLIRRIDLARAR